MGVPRTVGARTRLAALAAAGTIAAALATVSGAATADPAAPPAEVDTAPSRPAETVTTVRVGPFVLPPAPAGTVPHVNRVLPDIPKPCADCYITAIEPRLVNADGSRADMAEGVMLHHLVIAEAGRADVTCGRTDGIGAMGRRLFASGDERTPITLPDGFGFKVTPGQWVGIAELMNHGSVPQIVYFDAVVHHVPASTPGMKPVTPVWLDVNNCLTSEYAVPAGKSATPWSWASTLTGRIVAAGGHVHAGGVGLTLDNATLRQPICGSAATYGSGAFEGMVTSMSTCSWDSLGTLRAGDTLTMTSLYDAAQAMNDVMGIMLLAVYETSDLAGGTTAPAWMRKTPATEVPHGGGGHGH